MSCVFEGTQGLNFIDPWRPIHSTKNPSMSTYVIFRFVEARMRGWLPLAGGDECLTGGSCRTGSLKFTIRYGAL